MSRRSVGKQSRQVRRRTFVAAEGLGEVALARWLQDLRNENSPVHHHEVVNVMGGSIQSMVREAVKRRKQSDVASAKFEKLFIFLDDDRCAEDGQAGEKAIREIMKLGFIVFWQCPNMEGLLLRLHDGCETLNPSQDKAQSELIKQWPDYKKNFSRQDLSDRFVLQNLLNASRHDQNLTLLLAELELI